MTEDDTFRILARPKFDEMRAIHQRWKADQGRPSYHNIAFMKSYGWTWLEYIRERSERGYAN